MTNTEGTQGFRFLDRAPMVGDIITVTPSANRTFEVLALDDIDGELIYAEMIGEDSSAQWYSLKYVKVVDPSA